MVPRLPRVHWDRGDFSDQRACLEYPGMAGAGVVVSDVGMGLVRRDPGMGSGFDLAGVGRGWA